MPHGRAEHGLCGVSFLPFGALFRSADRSLDLLNVSDRCAREQTPQSPGEWGIERLPGRVPTYGNPRMVIPSGYLLLTGNLTNEAAYPRQPHGCPPASHLGLFSCHVYTNYKPLNNS